MRICSLLMGLTRRYLDKCFEILVERDGMEYEDAVENFEFNVVGAWVGDNTPVFISHMREP